MAIGIEFGLGFDVAFQMTQMIGLDSAEAFHHQPGDFRLLVIFGLCNTQLVFSLKCNVAFELIVARKVSMGED